MRGDTRNVLVIEDEPGLNDLFEIWLADRYDVTTATSGESALQALDASVDVMILDWRLPDISGEDILNYIDENELDPAVAVVTGAEPSAAGIGGRVDRVFQKPIDKTGLLDTIDALIDDE